MRLLEQIKLLRSEFPNIKIRQTTDNLNRKCAVFELERCAENIVLLFEYEYIILDFYGNKTVYGYQGEEFRYLINELNNLIECRTLILSVISGEVECGGYLTSKESLSDKLIREMAERRCREKFNGELPNNAFVYLYYCDTELDSCEYCDFSKK